MHVIDKKGYIFGKINFFDFLVICAVLLILSGVCVTNFLPNIKNRHIRRMPLQEAVLIKISPHKNSSRFISQIKIGDGQRDIETNYTGRIIEVEDNTVLGDSRETLITLRLNASLDDSGILSYGSNILQIGKNFRFSTRDYLLSGTIREIKRDYQ